MYLFTSESVLADAVTYVTLDGVVLVMNQSVVPFIVAGHL